MDDEPKYRLPEMLLREWDAAVKAFAILKAGGRIVEREIDGHICRYVVPKDISKIGKFNGGITWNT